MALHDETKSNPPKGPKTAIPESLVNDAVAAVESHQKKTEDTATRTNAESEPTMQAQEATPSDSELKELKERYLRLAADFENYKKRNQKERVEVLKYAAQSALREIVDVIDNLERALANLETSPDVTSIRNGIEMIHRQLCGILEKHSVKEIDCLHKEFSPVYHEAVLQIEDDKIPPNHVAEVHQKGYMIHDRLLRPARVAVSASKQEAPKQCADAPPPPQNEQEDSQS